jgi:hypothetical protein
VTAKTTKKAGRPAKGDEPPYNVEELDRLLVHGEHVEVDKGEIKVVYPTFRELALRYGCSLSTISDYAKAHNTARRRKAAGDRLRILSDAKLTELRADAVAITRDDEIRIIDTFIAQFEKALAEGRVRCDNIADFNTALRLKQLLMGDADSRSELNVTVSLQALQARHLESMRRVEVVHAAETGEAARAREPETPALPADAQVIDWMSGMQVEGEAPVLVGITPPRSELERRTTEFGREDSY